MTERFKAVLHSRSRSQPNLRIPHDHDEPILKKAHTMDRQQGLEHTATHLSLDGTTSVQTNAVMYSGLGGEEVLALQIGALRRVNEVFRANGLPVLDVGIVGVVRQSAFPSKRKWWEKMFKSKTKGGRNHVMGEHLVKSVEYASVPVDSSEHSFNIRRIPILIHECVNQLRVTGIFRVNGSEKRIADMIAEFDSAPTYGLGWSFTRNNAHDVASFLKKFLRALPEPLFCADLHEPFLQCMNLPLAQRSYALRLLLLLIPPQHLILIEYLLDLLFIVQNASSENQMTAYNLGVVFAPTLLRTKPNKPQGLSDYSQSAKVIEHMILNYQQFIITHPARHPMLALEPADLCQLPTVYSPAQLYIHLVRSKSTVGSRTEIVEMKKSSIVNVERRISQLKISSPLSEGTTQEEHANPKQSNNSTASQRHHSVHQSEQL